LTNGDSCGNQKLHQAKRHTECEGFQRFAFAGTIQYLPVQIAADIQYGHAGQRAQRRNQTHRDGQRQLDQFSAHLLGYPEASVFRNAFPASFKDIAPPKETLFFFLAFHGDQVVFGFFQSGIVAGQGEVGRIADKGCQGIQILPDFPVTESGALAEVPGEFAAMLPVHDGSRRFGIFPDGIGDGLVPHGTEPFFHQWSHALIRMCNRLRSPGIDC